MIDLCLANDVYTLLFMILFNKITNYIGPESTIVPICLDRPNIYFHFSASVAMHFSIISAIFPPEFDIRVLLLRVTFIMRAIAG